MNTLTLTQTRNIVRHFSLETWGKKAVLTNDWNPEDIANAIFKYCAVYRIDIVMALAQAIVESHFGVAPTAKRSRKTKNIYNVGNVDSGADESQDSWDEGIKRYCSLMQREYNWKEDAQGYVSLESMLMHDFTRPRGGRYATAKNYTRAVAQIANKIRSFSHPPAKNVK